MGYDMVCKLRNSSLSSLCQVKTDSPHVQMTNGGTNFRDKVCPTAENVMHN